MGIHQPIKFVRSDGSGVPVYQQSTQPIDEQLVTSAGGAIENLTSESVAVRLAYEWSAQGDEDIPNARVTDLSKISRNRRVPDYLQKGQHPPLVA